MVVRGKVLLGAGRAIALLLVLSACHLLLPFSSTSTPDPTTKPETTYKFKIPVYRCQSKGFKTAAAGKRGVTAWVEREGTLRLGDEVRLHIPAQRAWGASRSK